MTVDTQAMSSVLYAIPMLDLTKLQIDKLMENRNSFFDNLYEKPKDLNPVAIVIDLMRQIRAAAVPKDGITIMRLFSNIVSDVRKSFEEKKTKYVVVCFDRTIHFGREAKGAEHQKRYGESKRNHLISTWLSNNKKENELKSPFRDFYAKFPCSSISDVFGNKSSRKHFLNDLFRYMKFNLDIPEDKSLIIDGVDKYDFESDDPNEVSNDNPVLIVKNLDYDPDVPLKSNKNLCKHLSKIDFIHKATEGDIRGPFWANYFLNSFSKIASPDDGKLSVIFVSGDGDTFVTHALRQLSEEKQPRNVEIYWKRKFQDFHQYIPMIALCKKLKQNLPLWMEPQLLVSMRDKGGLLSPYEPSSEILKDRENCLEWLVFLFNLIKSDYFDKIPGTGIVSVIESWYKFRENHPYTPFISTKYYSNDENQEELGKLTELGRIVPGFIEYDIHENGWMKFMFCLLRKSNPNVLPSCTNPSNINDLIEAINLSKKKKYEETLRKWQIKKEAGKLKPSQLDKLPKIPDEITPRGIWYGRLRMRFLMNYYSNSILPNYPTSEARGCEVDKDGKSIHGWEVIDGKVCFSK